MGDIGVIAPPPRPFEQTALLKSAPGIQHIERADSTVDEYTSDDRTLKRQRSIGRDMPCPVHTTLTEAMPVVETVPHTSPFGAATRQLDRSNTGDICPSSCAPLKPQPRNYSDYQPDNRPGVNGRCSSDSFRPPTALRGFRDEPKLWVDDGPEAGKIAAEWKAEFVQLIHEQTEGWSSEERTQLFDNCIRVNKDRYLPAIAAFYFDYPNLLPADELRPLDEKTQEKIDLGFLISPKIDMKQQKVFGDWHWKPDAPVVDLVAQEGPKGEKTPDDVVECDHCIKEAKKTKLRKMLGRVVLLSKIRRPASSGPLQPEPPEDHAELHDTQSGAEASSASSRQSSSKKSSSSQASEDSKSRRALWHRRKAIRPRTSTGKPVPAAPSQKVGSVKAAG